ncbi:MAG TPA: hypothetical protein VGC05_12865, partial [Mycobacterium sp.]
SELLLEHTDERSESLLNLLRLVFCYLKRRGLRLAQGLLDVLLHRCSAQSQKAVFDTQPRGPTP